MFSKLPNIIKLNNLKIHLTKVNILLTSLTMTSIIFVLINIYLGVRVKNYVEQNAVISQKLSDTQKVLTALESQDQVVKNKILEAEIKSIHDEYKKLIASYEDIIDLKDAKVDTDQMDELLTFFQKETFHLQVQISQYLMQLSKNKLTN